MITMDDMTHDINVVCQTLKRKKIHVYAEQFIASKTLSTWVEKIHYINVVFIYYDNNILIYTYKHHAHKKL